MMKLVASHDLRNTPYRDQYLILQDAFTAEQTGTMKKR